mgnify:CR=1 FL=1
MPIQRSSRSDSVIAAQTLSIGAVKVRSMTRAKPAPKVGETSTKDGTWSSASPERGPTTVVRPGGERVEEHPDGRVVRTRLPLVPRYRQKVVEVPGHLANPAWVDDPDFDIGYHVRRSALPLSGFYPLATLALCVLAFALADLAHTSGFVAVYLCGLVLGNAALPHRSASIGFAEGMASLAQIGLFVLLGLLSSPSRLGSALVPALVVGIALVLLARPLSVIASAVLARPGRGPRRPGNRVGWRGTAARDANVRSAPHPDLTRQCSIPLGPDRPGRETGGLDVGARGGQLGTDLRRQLVAQLLQVRAAGDLAAALVEHPEAVKRGVGRHAGEPPRLRAVVDDDEAEPHGERAGGRL